MFYREAGQFKTSYAADMQVFPIRQDRIALWLLLIAAFFTAFFSFALAVRGYNHAGCLVNVPRGDALGVLRSARARCKRVSGGVRVRAVLEEEEVLVGRALVLLVAVWWR